MIFWKRVFIPLEVDGEVDFAGGLEGLLGKVLEEGEDFLVEAFAADRPAAGAAEDEGAFADVGEVEVFGTAGAEVVDFLLEHLEEEEFKAVAGVLGGAGHRDGEGRGEEFEVIGDGLAADAAEHALDALEEVLDGEEAPGALVLEVVEDAVADVVDEGEVGAVGFFGGAGESLVDPLGPVGGHLVAANFEDGKFSYEADHESVFEEAALHVVAERLVFEGLDFADEFADVVEAAVNRDVADVGDGIDFMQFVHDLGSDDVGGDFGEVVLVEFGEDFLHGAVEAIHGDGAFLAGLDEAAEELFAIEGFAGAVLLDDAEFGALDLFVGRVAIGAGEAFATTTNGRSVLRHTGIDHFVLLGTTLNAPHALGDKTGCYTACGGRKGKMLKQSVVFPVCDAMRIRVLKSFDWR